MTSTQTHEKHLMRISYSNIRSNSRHSCLWPPLPWAFDHVYSIDVNSLLWSGSRIQAESGRKPVESYTSFRLQGIYKRLWCWKHSPLQRRELWRGIKWRTLAQDKFPVSLNSQAYCSVVLWPALDALPSSVHWEILFQDSVQVTPFPLLLKTSSVPEGPPALAPHPMLGTLFPGQSYSLRPWSAPCGN